MVEKYTKWRLEMKLRRQNALKGEWLEAKNKADKLHQEYKATFKSDRERETPEGTEAAIAAYKASQRAERTHAHYRDYTKRVDAWNKKRAANKLRRQKAWSSIKEKWVAIWRGIQATVRETRAEIRTKASHAPGEGVFRKIRIARIYASGYVILALSVLTTSVGSTLGALFGTVATGGSWLLQRISEVLPTLWSSVWEALSWTVHWVLNVALLLVSGAVEIVLTAISWLVCLLSAPFVYTGRYFAERNAKVDDGSPVSPKPEPSKAPRRGPVAPEPVTV